VAVEAVRDILKRPRTPRIWALLGARKGDNNQVLALAEALGLPFVCKQLTYNHWRHLGPHLLGATLRSLTPGSRALLSGDLPDLTISTGHRSVAVVQSLRRRSGGRTHSIHVGYPRISPDKFDLVIATPEYPIREHPNLIRIPIALSRGARRPERHEDFWQSYPAPRRLLILGGPTLYWRLSPKTVGRALDDLLAKAKAHGGSVVVIGSPRTPRRLLLKAQERVRSVQVPATLVPVGGSPPYAELLEWADTISVTADSVAMVSDAISTGKPVELVPIQPTGAGWAVMALMDRVRPSEHAPPHDLRAFWRALKERGLVGSSSKGVEPVPDLTCSAVSRAKAIVGGLVSRVQ
jgi:mitochondrial fission protein ELM1